MVRALFCAAFASSALAADKPPVPAGRDPGGVAIAIIGPGFDYTVPALAARLARDGEGEIIGWDFIHNDRRPFEAATASPSPARILAREPGVRLVIARVDIANRDMAAKAIGWAARSPARIVLFDGGVDPALVEAARHQFPDTLFLVAGGANAAPASSP